MASFDGNGLQIDRLADVREDIENALKEAFGDGINLGEESPFGVITGIMSERYSLLWEILESIYQASFPNTAFGIYLDELVALNGIIREAATKSAVDLTFQRSTDTGTGDVTIPVGTQVTASGASNVVWTTEIEGTIASAVETTVVQAFADDFGPIGALAGTLTVLVSTPAEVESVTNLNDAELGDIEETDSELKLRRNIQLGREGTSTESGIRSALQLLDEVRATAVVVNDTDATDGDGRPPHSFEAYIGPETGVDLSQTITLSYDATLVDLNSISIEFDAIAIAGSPVVFNTTEAQTLIDIATAIEAESNILSAESDGTTITIIGATTTDIALTSTVTLGASQANSVVSVVNAANITTLDLISQTLWDSKAAGIQTHGGLTGTAVDTQGDNHAMSFSPISDRQIWVRVTLTTNGDYDSITAEPAIAQSLADYATNNLFPGVDVLNYKLVCAVSDVNVAGIEGILIETSVDNSIFNTDKIEIPVNEFATIDSDDVTFV